MLLMAFSVSSFAYVSLCNASVYCDITNYDDDYESGTLAQRPDGDVGFILNLQNFGQNTFSSAWISLDYGYVVSISQVDTGSKTTNNRTIDNNDSYISFELSSAAWGHDCGDCFASGSISIWLP